jgi:hypothetical protein
MVKGVRITVAITERLTLLGSFPGVSEVTIINEGERVTESLANPQDLNAKSLVWTLTGWVDFIDWFLNGPPWRRHLLWTSKDCFVGVFRCKDERSKLLDLAHRYFSVGASDSCSFYALAVQVEVPASRAHPMILAKSAGAAFNIMSELFLPLLARGNFTSIALHCCSAGPPPFDHLASTLPISSLDLGLIMQGNPTLRRLELDGLVIDPDQLQVIMSWTRRTEHTQFAVEIRRCALRQGGRTLRDCFIQDSRRGPTHLTVETCTFPSVPSAMPARNPANIEACLPASEGENVEFLSDSPRDEYRRFADAIGRENPMLSLTIRGYREETRRLCHSMTTNTRLVQLDLSSAPSRFVSSIAIAARHCELAAQAIPDENDGWLNVLLSSLRHHPSLRSLDIRNTVGTVAEEVNGRRGRTSCLMDMLADNCILLNVRYTAREIDPQMNLRIRWYLIRNRVRYLATIQPCSLQNTLLYCLLKDIQRPSECHHDTVTNESDRVNDTFRYLNACFAEMR